MIVKKNNVHYIFNACAVVQNTENLCAENPENSFGFNSNSTTQRGRRSSLSGQNDSDLPFDRRCQQKCTLL